MIGCKGLIIVNMTRAKSLRVVNNALAKCPAAKYGLQRIKVTSIPSFEGRKIDFFLFNWIQTFNLTFP